MRIIIFDDIKLRKLVSLRFLFPILHFYSQEHINTAHYKLRFLL